LAEDSASIDLRDYFEARLTELHRLIVAGDERLGSEFRIVREASDKAIDKAQEAADKQLEFHNNLIRQMERKDALYATALEVRALERTISGSAKESLPREVAETKFEAVNERLAILEAANRYDEGRQKGVGLSAGVLVGALTALATIIGIIVVLANVVTGK
jgi:hypothetical protein